MSFPHRLPQDGGGVECEHVKQSPRPSSFRSVPRSPQPTQPTQPTHPPTCTPPTVRNHSHAVLIAELPALLGPRGAVSTPPASEQAVAAMRPVPLGHACAGVPPTGIAAEPGVFLAPSPCPAAVPVALLTARDLDLVLAGSLRHDVLATSCFSRMLEEKDSSWCSKFFLNTRALELSSPLRATSGDAIVIEMSSYARPITAQPQRVWGPV